MTGYPKILFGIAAIFLTLSYIYLEAFNERCSRFINVDCGGKEEQVLEKKISMLFDFQKFEKNADLQSVIDAVHARYTARKLSDDEAELVAAAGMPDTAFKRKQPKEEWE